MKAFYVRTRQNQKRVGRASEIEFGSSAIVNAMEVADRKRGLGALALIQNTLHAEENISHTVGGHTVRREVRHRLRGSNKFKSSTDRKLYNFIEAVAG